MTIDTDIKRGFWMIKRNVLEEYRIDPAKVTKEGQVDKPLAEKYQDLQDDIRSLGRVAVAFSGGVDSTLLLKVAHDQLGDRAIAVTAKSKSFPERELRESDDFCREEGIRHFYTDSEELDLPGFRQNPTNRCYLCKKELFTEIGKLAQQEADGEKVYILEGSNMDDNGDFRPGLKAVEELGVLSPLRRAGLNKAEIRELSKMLGLKTYRKQSFACLSSRFVYGETISDQKLRMVDLAEQFLLDLGFDQLRVRIHGDSDFIARIEVPIDAIPRLASPEIRRKVNLHLHSLGFTYVTLDLAGYQTGSMNAGLR